MSAPHKPKAKTLDVISPSGRLCKRRSSAHKVTWLCQWCGAERTTWQYTGPAPRYCAECRQPAQNAQAAALRRQGRIRGGGGGGGGGAADGGEGGPRLAQGLVMRAGGAEGGRQGRHVR